LFADAPSNGVLYARIDGTWSNVTSGIEDAPADDDTYARVNNEWTNVTEYLWIDAPADSNIYARIDNSWTNITDLLGDVGGADNLGNHIADSNLFMGNFEIIFTNDFTDTTNNVYELEDTTQTVSAVQIAKWDDEAGIGGDKNAKYMCFVVPLNPGGYPGNWTDFEIKIEEITNTVPAPFNLVYLWNSMGDPWDDPDPNYGDTNARCYFTEDYQMEAPLLLDARKWQLHTNPTPAVIDVTSIASRFNHIDSMVQTILFYPSHNGCLMEWTDWQWYTNAHNLRASWSRFSLSNSEKNGLGTQIWHPIRIDWCPKRMNEAPLPMD
jgi:hypothetical protein